MTVWEQAFKSIGLSDEDIHEFFRSFCHLSDTNEKIGVALAFDVISWAL